jgi:hypothetical protein
MDIMMRVFETAPPLIQLLLAALIIIAYFDKNGTYRNGRRSRRGVARETLDAVSRQECHANIESFKTDMNARFNETNQEIHDVKESINTIIKAMLHKG